LQHGSDDVIQRMGRRITVEDYRSILADLRQKSPYAALGADVIVGFPGEKERDFETMAEFLDQSPLTYFHVFSYSPRPGTPASRWKQVDEKTKKKRSARLRILSQKKNLRFRRNMVADVQDGVVIKKKDGTAHVITSNYVPVKVSGCEFMEREQVRVRITQVEEKTTLGQAVDG
jgi:threonylcarbamoyladenosine tRNA methylthiotransferase MtaB